MKRYLSCLLLITSILLSACDKDDQPEANKNPITIRYDFSADVAGAYHFQILTDTTSYSETLTTTSWSKTVVVAANTTTGSDTAKLTIYPPSDWDGTGNK